VERLKEQLPPDRNSHLFINNWFQFIHERYWLRNWRKILKRASLMFGAALLCTNLTYIMKDISV